MLFLSSWGGHDLTVAVAVDVDGVGSENESGRGGGCINYIIKCRFNQPSDNGRSTKLIFWKNCKVKLLNK